MKERIVIYNGIDKEPVFVTEWRTVREGYEVNSTGSKIQQAIVDKHTMIFVATKDDGETVVVYHIPCEKLINNIVCLEIE